MNLMRLSEWISGEFEAHLIEADYDRTDIDRFESEFERLVLLRLMSGILDGANPDEECSKVMDDRTLVDSLISDARELSSLE